MNMPFKLADSSDLETPIPLMRAYYEFDEFPFDESPKWASPFAATS